jgi:hypothetical protein
LAEHAAKGTHMSAQQLKVESLVHFQISAYLRNLSRAIGHALSAITEMQLQISNLLSEADTMVQSAAAVPKQAILPLFYKAGQLFQVSTHTLCGAFRTWQVLRDRTTHLHMKVTVCSALYRKGVHDADDRNASHCPLLSIDRGLEVLCKCRAC